MIFSRSNCFLGRNPSNINFDDGKPLDTKAVNAALGPGIQITSRLFDLACFTRSSPDHRFQVSLHHLQCNRFTCLEFINYFWILLKNSLY